jgi:hypothetical protein
MKKRVPPALVLFFLLPVIAELLSGSSPPAFAGRPATAGVASAALPATIDVSLPSASTGTPGHCFYLPLVLKTFPFPGSTLTSTTTPTWNVEPGIASSLASVARTTPAIAGP